MKGNRIHIAGKRRKHIFLALFLSLSFCGYGQDYMKDMQKIREHYKSGDITFKMKYCFYPYDSIHTAVDSVRAQCYINGNDYYYKISTNAGTYEYYRNNRYYFVIDHFNKAIAVKKSSDAQMQNWDLSRLDSIVKSPMVKISYKDAGNNKGEYDMQTGNTAWDKCRIIYNKSSYVVEEMDMYSTQKGEMEGQKYDHPVISIYYTGYSYQAFNKSIFSERDYFTDTKSNIVLNSTYGKYRLLDYIYPSNHKG